MKHKILFGAFSLIILAASLAVAADDDAGVRTWTSTKGSTVTAQFVKLAFGKVYLKKEDGETLGIVLDGLSAEDQRVALQLAKVSTSPQRAKLKLRPGEIAGMPDIKITSQNDPTRPVPGGVRWFGRDHDKIMNLTRAGGFELCFLGDSITQGWWEHGGLFTQYFGKYKPVNFGIGGDRAENVLWRLNAGELVGTSPKVIVLLLGTNNSGFNTPEEIAVGVGTVLKKLRTILPEVKILLLAIFPSQNAEHRAKTDATNPFLAKMDDGNYVHYLDINDKFMDAKGNLRRDLFRDDVHLNANGYVVWGEAIGPKLKQLMK